MVIDKVILIASSIIKNKEGKVLLLQRSDSASFPDHWQLVEGKIDGDERPDDALKREIAEEIGVKVKKLELSTPMYSQVEANGIMYLGVRIIFNVVIDSEDIQLSDEHKSFGWYSQSEALALPLLPGIKEVVEKLL